MSNCLTQIRELFISKIPFFLHLSGWPIYLSLYGYKLCWKSRPIIFLLWNTLYPTTLQFLLALADQCLGTNSKQNFCKKLCGWRTDFFLIEYCDLKRAYTWLWLIFNNSLIRGRQIDKHIWGSWTCIWIPKHISLKAEIISIGSS